MINIQFSTNNDCFWETIGEDGYFNTTEYFNCDAVEEILQYIVFSMRQGDTSGKISDTNGNTIGEWSSI